MDLSNGKESVNPTTGYPGWEERECFCVSDFVADSYGEPTECSCCAGWGSYSLHIASGAEAMYPGGPFVGKSPRRS